MNEGTFGAKNIGLTLFDGTFEAKNIGHNSYKGYYRCQEKSKEGGVVREVTTSPGQIYIFKLEKCKQLAISRPFWSIR